MIVTIIHLFLQFIHKLKFFLPMKPRLPILSVVAALSVFIIGTAQARVVSMGEREKELSVLTRENPSYDSTGFRFAGLVLRAAVVNSLEYKDNLYSSQTNETEDLLHIIKPSLALISDFSRHEVSASVVAEKGSYRKISGEDYLDYTARIGVRADVLGNISVPVSVTYSKGHSQRSDPEYENEVKPTLYNELIFNTAIDYKGANVDFLVSASLKKLAFKDNATPTAFVDNSDRDRGEMLVSASLGFAKNRVISPFIFTDFKKVSYDRRVDNNGLRRSSRGFIGGVGLNIASSSSLIGANIRVGHLNRSFDDTSFSDVNALVYSSNIRWEPSTLLALNFSGERRIAESTLSNSSSSVDDVFSASAYYELTPNIFLNPNLSYSVKNYSGDTDRALHKTVGKMNVIYKINRNIWLSGAYEYLKQDESENGVDLKAFDSNLYNISMKLQI